MNDQNKKTYLTPPRLSQRLIIWGFYPSEAIFLIFLLIGAFFFIFQSLFMQSWLILFPMGFALLKIRLGEDRQNLEHILRIRYRYLRQAQIFTLLECFEEKNKKKKRKGKPT